MANIDLKDIYWAAGFLDGEGNFRFTKSNSVEITAFQKEREVLDRLVRCFGGNVNPVKDEGYVWQFCSNPAMGLMYTLYPLLSSKRQKEITKVAKEWKSTKIIAACSKYKTHCTKGHIWTDKNRYFNGGRSWCGKCRFGESWINPKYVEPEVRDSVRVKDEEVSPLFKKLNWVAGFLEAEGTFGYYNSRVIISAPQNSPELLNRSVEYFGGTVYPPYETKDIYSYQFGGEGAASLMMTLYFVMSEKRKSEISKTLNRWKSVPLSAAKHIEVFGKCRKGHNWTPENIMIRVSNGKECRMCKLCNEFRMLERPNYNHNYYLANMEKFKARSKLWKAQHKINSIERGIR